MVHNVYCKTPVISPKAVSNMVIWDQKSGLWFSFKSACPKQQALAVHSKICCKGWRNFESMVKVNVNNTDDTDVCPHKNMKALSADLNSSDLISGSEASLNPSLNHSDIT